MLKNGHLLCSRRAPVPQWIALLTVVCSFPLSSQVLPFRTYTTKDGLPSNIIRVIAQDSRGFLWIGTAEGLSLYDGTAFTNYTTADGLALDFINDIIEDRTSPGTMWIATGKGVNKFADGTFTTFHLGSRPAHDFVETVIQDRSGDVWCGSDSGLYRIHAGATTEVHSERALWGILGLGETSDSTMLISGASGLCLYTRTSGELHDIDIGEPEHRSERVWIDPSGDAYVGTYRGQVLHVRGRDVLHRYETGLPTDESYSTFYALAGDREGNLWACTRSGLVRMPTGSISPVSVVRYTTDNGLPENELFAFLIDHEGDQWIGSFTRGLAKLSENTVYRFPLAKGSLYSINSSGGILDAASHLWLIDLKGLWEIWQEPGGSWKTYYHRLLDAQSPASFTATVKRDTRGRLWVASYRPTALRCYVPQHRAGNASRLELLKECVLTGADQHGITCFIIDRKDLIWLSADSVVVVDPFDPRPVKKKYSRADGIPETSIRALYEDSRGNIWIGGGFGGGVAVVSQGDWTRPVTERYTLRSGLPDGFIRAFGEDRHGRMLIGSRFGGLITLQGGIFSSFTTKDGLLSNGILGIARDSSGTVAVATHLGVQLLSDSPAVRLETNRELIGGPVWSFGIWPGKGLWLTQDDALVLYEYPRRVPARPPPEAYITAISVNGRRCPPGSDLTFAYDQNNILMSFVGIAFRDERANRYQYRLLENGQEWQPLTRQAFVTYAALRPGTYTFEVKAINSDGIESPRPASVRFVILSPFWQRWWFYLLGVAAIVGLTLIAYQYRVRQLLKLERMRTRIASDLHDDIGASLTRIALFSEVAKEEAARGSPRLVEMADKIGANARELLDSVGTLVWSIDPRHDKFDEFLVHLTNFAQEMLALKGIDYALTVQPGVRDLPLSLEARKNVLLIFKEAINNIVRHAGARKVAVDFTLRDRTLEMRIADDGVGIASDHLRPGHGLMNMRARAERIGGVFEILTGAGQGTTIRLTVRADT